MLGVTRDAKPTLMIRYSRPARSAQANHRRLVCMLHIVEQVELILYTRDVATGIVTLDPIADLRRVTRDSEIAHVRSVRSISER